jgi:hypothetical protein
MTVVSNSSKSKIPCTSPQAFRDCNAGSGKLRTGHTHRANSFRCDASRRLGKLRSVHPSR